MAENTEPATTLIARRPCGCVYAAGDPKEGSGWMELDDDEEAAEVPTAEFRLLPWACPRCDIGAAVAAERERCARAAEQYPADPAFYTAALAATCAEIAAAIRESPR